MTLGEISHNSLSIYPQLGLIVFLAVFVAVTVRALRRPRADIDRWAHLPLEERGGERSGTTESGGGRR